MGPTTDGPGWFIFRDESRGKTVFHAGGMPGAVTILLHQVARDQTVIVLDNTGSEGIYKNAQQALAILNHQLPQPAKTNLGRVYLRTLMSSGNNAAAAKLIRSIADTARYSFSENEVNNIAYDLLQDGHQPLALEAFKTNCLLFPGSDNAAESYGEALEQAGLKNEAIRLYRRALEIAPANDDAKKGLQRLLHR